MKLILKNLRLLVVQEGVMGAVKEESRKRNLTEEQLEQVMDQHGEYLIRLAYFYLKDWSIAEDIIQEVFIAYYRKANQFEQRSSLKTYLSRITINKCHDHLRSWKNRRFIFSELIGNPNSKSPENLYEEQTGQTNLTNRVLALPVKYREVILLYYYQEFTGKEISLLLNCSENTVKTRMRRAKALLKEQVDPKEWEGLLDEQI